MNLYVNLYTCGICGPGILGANGNHRKKSHSPRLLSEQNAKSWSRTAPNASERLEPFSPPFEAALI